MVIALHKFQFAAQRNTRVVMREKNLNIEYGELYLSSSFSIKDLDHVFLLVKLQARKGCWDLLGITWDLCHL